MAVDYFSGAKLIAIYCIANYICNLCFQLNLLNALYATIPSTQKNV